MKSLFKFAFGAALMLLSSLSILNAQTNLSVQGTIQNFNGSAVDNGLYDVIFKLYTTDAGGAAVWSETQSVQVTGGVYSVLLGSVTPLTAAFDQTYYLGITLPGGPELTPRSRLTSSPYALSLIGQSNIFPSTGAVGAGTATPTAGNELHVKDATAAAQVLVEGATTSKVVLQSTDGSEIEFKKGANSASITYDGTNINVEGLNLVFDAGINLPAGQTVKYNGLSDWRLVDVDDFESSVEGWQTFVQLSATTPNATPPILLTFSGANKVQSGKAIAPPNISNYLVLKKLYNLAGIPHTQVKIKCTTYFTGSPSNEYLFAALASSTSSTAYEFLWYDFSDVGASFHGYSVYSTNMASRTAGKREDHEFTFTSSADAFAFIVGSQMDEAPDNESFMIDNVEIWVK